MNFDFKPQVPQQQSQNFTPCESNVDFAAINDYQKEKLGGVGKHQYIGVISQVIELGLQKQDQKVVPWSGKDKTDHEWRLEKRDDGSQKDPTAQLEQRKFKGTMQECLVYQPDPVAQAAIVVDFPEVMMNLGQFFNPEGETSEKPFRDIIGQSGFVPKEKWGKNVIAKPFNLRHVNVNRQKEGAQYHAAFAKNSMIHDLAEWAGVLDADGNFHIEDMGSLIGKPVNFDVEVKVETWQKKDGSGEGSKLVIDSKPSSKLSPRDRKYYDDELAEKMTEDLYGVLLFQGGNNEKTLKEVRKSLVNTMQFALNWEDCKLKEELEKVNPRVLGLVQNATQQQSQASQQPSKQVQAEGKKVAQSEPQEPQNQYNELSMDFDDDQQ